MFAYQVRKFIGAYAAVLNGLDTLVFTGGIGERAAEVRVKICLGLEYLGVALDTRGQRPKCRSDQSASQQMHRTGGPNRRRPDDRAPYP